MVQNMEIDYVHYGLFPHFAGGVIFMAKITLSKSLLSVIAVGGIEEK